MKDCHVHTNISHDGISSMEEYLAAAREKGVDEIIFTEHYDVYDGLETKLRTLDTDRYEAAYRSLRNDGPVRTGFGIEIGLQPHITEQVKAMLKQHAFDFIIGSSHITCGKDMAYDRSFFEGLTRREAYGRYFAEVLENIRIYTDEFDVYGHLDYVVRYGGYAEKKIGYADFREVLDEILRSLIRKDKGLEVNTSGIRYGLGSAHPNREILRRYRELGGRLVTLGSDAHRTEQLAADFGEALAMIEEAGFRELAVFRGRVPQLIGIEEY